MTAKKTPTKKTPPKGGPEVFMLEKGLTRAEALKIAVKRARRDHRGFSYDEKTGKATLV